MKYSVATAAAAFAAGALARPEFTNSKFDVEEGKPFELTFSGCDDGCTIVLKNGSSGNLKDVDTLTTSATGGSFTFTPEDLPSDTYAFEIYTNGDKTDNNYSKQFEYEGTASASSSAASSASSAASTSAPASTSSAEKTSSAASSKTSEASSSMTSSASTTVSKTTTAGSSTSPAASATTTPPDSAGSTRYSSIALVVGAVAAIAFFN